MESERAMSENGVFVIDAGIVDTGRTDSSAGSFDDCEWFAQVLVWVAVVAAAVVAAVVEVSTSPLRDQLFEPVSL